MNKMMKKQRYALRKLTGGLVSVAVATVMGVAISGQVQAAEFAVDETILVEALEDQEAAPVEENKQTTPRETTEAMPDQQPVDEQKIYEIGPDKVVASTKKPEVAPVQLSNKPDRIAMAMTEDPAHSMNWNYFTKDALDDAGVWVSENENLTDAQFFPAHSFPVSSYFHEKTKDGYLIFKREDKETGKNYYYTDAGIRSDNQAWTDSKGKPATVAYEIIWETANQVTARNLKPGTRYFYQLGSKALGKLSPIGQFKTAATGAKPFTFIHVTDSQNAWWNENVRNEAAFGADTLAHAKAAAEALYGESAFILHTGDFIQTSKENNEDEYKSIFNLSQGTMLDQPFTFIAGNHDENTDPAYGGSVTDDREFIEHTNAPITNEAVDGGSYYSFDYQGVHIAVLNTNDSDKASTDDNPTLASIGEAQFAWLEKDLAAASKRGVNYLILAYHKPLYSASYHALSDDDVRAARDRLAKLTDKYQVDVVLSGHDHSLAITKPLQFDEASFVNAKVADFHILGEDADGEPIIQSPGTFYLNPNTIGTKAYADIYNWGLKKIWQVEEQLSPQGKYPLTQAQLDEYRKLFFKMEQPNSSKKYQKDHSNYRDASIQNFYLVNVTPAGIKVHLYQVAGDLAKGEKREMTRLMGFTIANRQATAADFLSTEEEPAQKPKPSLPDAEAHTPPVGAAASPMLAPSRPQDQTLPQTGAYSTFGLGLVVGLTGLSLLGLAARQKKED